LNNTKVSAQDISVSLAAKLGIGSIFSGSVSYNDHGYYLDAMAFSDQYQERSGPDATVYATWWASDFGYCYEFKRCKRIFL